MKHNQHLYKVNILIIINEYWYLSLLLLLDPVDKPVSLSPDGNTPTSKNNETQQEKCKR